ncbi:MAG: hypothetical protein QJR07_14310 [Acetobacteraceae bacterium]|nr:hypothetical protein [Acetobacteraceae bacterium]MDI3308262.1 hypothetical protein [Acetobacteraceae bacterium]
MESNEIRKVSEISDAELDAVSGGWGFLNINYSSITQVNAVGEGSFNDQSNQALSVQANQSGVKVFAFFKNRQ